MISPDATFDQVLDAVEHLPVDQQVDLIEVMQRRLAERGRQRIVQEASEARAEFASGQAKRTSVEDLMREIGQ